MLHSVTIGMLIDISNEIRSVRDELEMKSGHARFHDLDEEIMREAIKLRNLEEFVDALIEMEEKWDKLSK